jgi:DNA-binding MarR family transcriptional regulator
MSTPPLEDLAIPPLLRGARGSYGQALTTRLAEAGFDDIPRNGTWVLGGMGTRGASAAEMIEGLDVTKQAASQLIDALVVRGYLTRDVNPDDRRRMIIGLTDRGQAAADVAGAAIGEVDDLLAERITPGQLAGLKIGLLALAEIKAENRGA